ncbi:MAG: MaoC/PaaZ C-terminal domain-containing protein [Candidatus Doudnabacteria bacterium]
MDTSSSSAKKSSVPVRPESSWEDPAISTESRVIDEDAISRFSAAVGEDNQIHFSDRAAQEAGFLRRVAPGKLVESIGVDLIRRSLNSHSRYPILLEDCWRLLAPVYIGDEIFLRYTYRNKLGVCVIGGEIYAIRADQEVRVASGSIKAKCP